MFDCISKDAQIDVSPKIHFECPACGADITKDFICIGARHIYIDCPYCRTNMVFGIDWRNDV
jgi:predicted RNA-binding Zn-ribbon protein involved in translation (DUF1610 family)